LTSSSPNVLILQGASAYPTVAGEGSATNTAQFAFFVGNATPCGATLPFTLTVNYTGNGPHPVALTFSIPTGRPSTTAVNFAYAGAAVAIPDDGPAGVDVPITVSGFTGTVGKVAFNIGGTACNAGQGSTTVGIDHSWVGDLTLTLTSPSGHTVTLLDRPGGAGNSGNNFCQTVLADGAANSIQGIAIAQAPFTGTFSPAQPLSTFLGDTGSGTWILHATDHAFLDSGSVRAVSLDLSGFSCTR
jgi:hypothetical protein